MDTRDMAGPGVSDPTRTLIGGDTFAGRYHIDRELGRGAFGIVYEARDEMTNARVALKVLRPNRISLSSNRWREASALRRLQVPGVARMLDEGHVGDVPYVVMEYIEGEEFPGPMDPRPWDELRGPAVQLLRILAVVHGEGVIHGDLKPSNVMLTDSGVVLLDFGLATSAAVSSYESGEGSRGTPIYMAPELFADEPATPQSDLFAVGTMLFEALTGRPFFPQASLINWIRKLATEGPPPLASVDPSMPEEAVRIVDALLQVDRANRPASAAAALTLLDASAEAPSLPWLEDRQGEWLLPELEDLFVGPEVAFHLKSKPARILWERTLGCARDVASELEAWFAMGLVIPEKRGLRTSLRALQMLERGLRPRPPIIHQIDEVTAEVAAWVRLAEPISITELARLSGYRLGDIDDALGRLEQERFVRQDQDQWYRVRDIDFSEVLPDGWFDAAREKLLQVSTDPLRRFELALTTDDADSIRRAGVVAAHQFTDQGRIAQAHATFRATVLRLRSMKNDRVRDVVVEWGRFALARNSASMIEEVLWVWGTHDQRLRNLLEMSRSVAVKQDESTARRLEELGEFEDPEVEFARISSLSIAQGWYTGGFKKQLDRMEQIALENEHLVQLNATVRMRRGFVAYADGDYARAAQLHLQAAAMAHAVDMRLKNVVNAIWSLMDAFEFGDALELAEKHLPEVKQLADPHLELQFEAARRQAIFRGGTDLEPSRDMLAAALEVGYQPLINVIVCQEAGALWRMGKRDAAADVARTTARQWSAEDSNWTILPIVVFHAFLAGESLSAAVFDAVETCPYPRLKAQMLGFASYIVGFGHDEMRDAARDLVEDELHSIRLELIAIDEIDRLDQIGLD